MERLTLEDLTRIRDEYAGRLDAVRAECEQAVVERKLGTDRMVSPRPLFDQIEQRGQWNATPKRWWVEEGDESIYLPQKHGFDAEDRLRTLGDRTCFVYGDGFVDEIVAVRERSGSKKQDSPPLLVLRYVLSPNGEADLIYRIDQEGSASVETFFRESGRVVADEERMSGFDKNLWADAALASKNVYEWQGDRVVRVIHESALKRNPTAKTVIFAWATGDTLESTTESMISALVDYAIEKAKVAVASGFLSEENPLDVVAIEYCGEDIPSGFPSDVSLIARSGREALFDGDPEENAWQLWCPAEWNEDVCVLVRVAEPFRLEEAGLRLLQIVDGPDVFLEDDAILPLRAALQAAARRLNELDWSAIAPVSDMFFAVALDDTGEIDATEDLEASAPTEKIERLVAAGWLPPIDDDEDFDEDEDESVEEDDE